MWILKLINYYINRWNNLLFYQSFGLISVQFGAILVTSSKYFSIARALGIPDIFFHSSYFALSISFNTDGLLTLDGTSPTITYL